MRGSRNFHERGSNENGNFWSQTRGGPTSKKFRNYLFLGKIFKFQGGPDPRSPPLDPRMYAVVRNKILKCAYNLIILEILSLENVDLPH